MKKLLIILAMIFIGCSESGNSVAALDFDPTVENDSTEIDSIVPIDTIDTIDSVKETKDTIINTKKNKEESSNSNEVTSSSSTKKDTVVESSSSKVKDKSSSSINDKKEESSSSMEKKNESSSSELIVSSSSEKKVESSSSSEIVESSSSSDNDDYIDENEPKNTKHTYVELYELTLNGFRVENNIAYLSWENNTNFTMQINVEYYISCKNEDADSTIMYTIKANSVKEKAIYEIKNDAQKCVGFVKNLTATENDKSNFVGWRWDSDRGVENIIFKN